MSGVTGSSGFDARHAETFGEDHGVSADDGESRSGSVGGVQFILNNALESGEIRGMSAANKKQKVKEMPSPVHIALARICSAR